MPENPVGLQELIGDVEWAAPMPADQVAKLPKRERLELVKPHLRDHDAQPSRGIGREPDQLGWEIRETPGSKARWNWIYRALRETLHGGELGQARSETRCEDEHGHYWEPAWGAIRVVENGWLKHEAEVGYPRSIRRSEDRYTHGAERRSAERWVARKKRRYERYVLRLIAEGVYDESGYER